MSTPAGGGYFEFGTNAEEVARRIATSMGQIQSEMAKASTRSGGFQSSAGLGEFERGLVGINRQVNDLTNAMANGAMAPAKYVAEVQKLAKTGLADVQQQQLTGLLRAPTQFLQGLNFRELGAASGRAFGDNLVAQAEQVVSTLPKKFARQQAFLNDLRSTVSSQAGPLALELGATASSIDRARLAKFKEDLAVSYGRGNISSQDIGQRFPGFLERAQQDPALSPLLEGQRGAGRPAQDHLRAMEAEAATAHKLADEQVRDQQRLSADEARRTVQLEAHQKRQEAARNREMAQQRQLATFQNQTYDQQAATLDRAHVMNRAEDERRAKAAQAATKVQAERDNANRIAEQGTRFGSFGRVGEDLFRVNAGGASATKIELGERLAINQALMAEQAHRQKVMHQQERQNILSMRESGSLGDNFLSGAMGRGINGSAGKPSFSQGVRNELATIGTVARYGGASAVLYGLMGALTDTGREVLDFTDSLTDLKVALNVENVGTGLVDDLQQIAVLSGANTGAALDAAARGARAFGDVAKTSGADTAQAGTDIATAATKIALITNKDLKDATGDVIAIASAFGLAASQANQVVDAVSAAKDFGGDPANIAQGLANFATTADAAGFTLGESANALSLVIARTDQSGQAAATRLSRITSILAGTTGRSVIADLNAAGLRDNSGAAINPEASVRDQLRQIAQAYQKAGPELQGKIRSALGGTSNLRELLPLLEPGETDGSSLFDKVLGEAGNQSGRGEQEFRRRATDLVGTLRKLQGDISAIQVNLFRSGAFDGIALAFAGLEPALNVLSRLLGLLAAMPGPLKTIVGLALDLKVALLALKTLGVIQSASLTGALGLGGVRGAVAGGGAESVATARKAAADSAAAVAAAEVSVALHTLNVAIYESVGATASSSRAQLTEAIASEAAAKADLQEATASLAAARGGVGAGVASAASGIGGQLRAAAPYLAAAVAVGAVYTAFQVADKEQAIQGSRARSAQAVTGADLSDAGSVRETANSLRANAAELRESQKGWNSLSSLMVKSQRDTTIAAEHSTEKQLRALAKRIDAEDKHAIALQRASLFGDDAAASTDAVANALAKLASTGADAVGIFTQLVGAITREPEANGRRSLPTDSPNKFAAAVTTELLQGIIPGSRRKGDDLRFPGGLPQIIPGSPFPVATEFSGKEISQQTAGRFAAIQKAAFDKLVSFNLPEGVAPSTDQLNDVIDAALKASGLDQVGPEYAALRKFLRERILGKVTADLGSAAAAPQNQPLDPKAALDQIIGTDTIPGLTKQYNDALGALPTSDIGGRQKLGSQYLQGLSVLQSRAALGNTGEAANPEAMASIARAIAVAKEAVSNDLIADMEDVRKASQSQAKTKAEVRRIGAQAFEDEVAVAVEAGNVAALTAIFDLASRAQINAAIAAMEAKAAAEQAALNAAQETAAALGEIGGGAQYSAGSAIASYEKDQKGKITDLERGLGNLRDARKRANPRRNGKSDFLNPDAEGSDEDALTAAQLRAARLDAQVSANDKRGQARADLRTARANLAAIDKAEDPAGYYAAQKALSQAKATYAETEVSLAASARNLRAARRGGDLVAARVSLANALDDLTQYEKGTEEYNTALAKVVEAQRAAAEAAAGLKFLRRRANSDLTDDVAQATIDRQEAEAKLRRDRRRGAGPDVIAQDRLDVQSAQNQEEAAAFSRKLGDAQTAEQLGRISHAAYIRFLQGEHDRLTSVKNKSRQQIDQLNEIDQALKAASEQMSGQFNLGDIKVPTPYEARTAINSSRVNIAGQQTGTSQTVAIQIDGADTGQILTVLQRVLGPLNIQRSTPSASRKK